MDYEFDVVAEMDLDHSLVVTKTRCPDLDGVVMRRPDGELGRTLGPIIVVMAPRLPAPLGQPSKAAFASGPASPPDRMIGGWSVR